MDCEEARETLSALLDGERVEVEPEELEAHLAACSACEVWREAAHVLTRASRLQPSPSPRPSQGVFDAVARERRSAGRRGSMTGTRWALAVVAVMQLALSVPALLLGQDHSAPVHVAHEMGSLDVAVAVGFLVAARRPARAMGMLGLVGVAAGLLVLTAGIDLGLGRTDLLDEAPHLVLVAGWVLLRRLALLAPPSGDRPRSLLGLWQKARAVYGGHPARLPEEVLAATGHPGAPAASACGRAEPVAARQPVARDRKEAVG